MTHRRKKFGLQTRGRERIVTRLFQSCLKFTTLCDIESEQHNTANRSIRSVPRPNFPLQPLNRTIFMNKRVRQRCLHRTSQAPSVNFTPTLMGVREYIIVRPSNDTLSDQLVIGHPLLAHHEIAHLTIEHRHRRRRMLGKQPHARFARQQSRLRLNHLGDVTIHANHTHGFTCMIGLHLFLRLDVTEGSVVESTNSEMPSALARRLNRLQQVQLLRGQVFRQHNRVPKFRRKVSIRSASQTINLENAVISQHTVRNQIPVPNSDFSDRRRQVHALGGLMQRLFCPPLLGDIDKTADHRTHHASAVANRLVIHRNPCDRTILFFNPENDSTDRYSRIEGDCDGSRFSRQNLPFLINYLPPGRHRLPAKKLVPIQAKNPFGRSVRLQDFRRIFLQQKTFVQRIEN